MRKSISKAKDLYGAAHSNRSIES